MTTFIYKDLETTVEYIAPPPPPEKEADCCGNCFFERPGFRDGDPVFECHRNAPQKTHGVGTGYEEHRWPEVEYDKWCGEHRRKE